MGWSGDTPIRTRDSRLTISPFCHGLLDDPLPDAETAAAYREYRTDRHDFLGMLLRAERTSARAWRCVKLIACDLLDSGDELPPALRAWLSAYVKGLRPQPPRREPDVHHYRDSLIVTAIGALVGRGYTPATRHHNKPLYPSGMRRCDYGRACEQGGSIADAVGEAFGMGLDSVRGVWDNRKRKAIEPFTLTTSP